MDSRGDQRPPRSTRPGSSQPASPAPAYPDSAAYSRPPLSSNESSKANVSFQNVEKGDRNDHLDPRRQRSLPSAYHPQLTDPEYSDQFDPSRVARKKSLVKPDREKIDQNHRQWHYRSHVAQLEEEGNTRVGVLPSSTHTCYLCFSRTLVETSFLSIFPWLLHTNFYYKYSFFSLIQPPGITHSGEDVPSLPERRMFTNLAWLFSNEVIQYDGNVSHPCQPHQPLAFRMSRRNEAVGLVLAPADLG